MTPFVSGCFLASAIAFVASGAVLTFVDRGENSWVRGCYGTFGFLAACGLALIGGLAMIVSSRNHYGILFLFAFAFILVIISPKLEPEHDEH